ncbi:MAG TPA: BatA domain-containing protein [Saprospiraceae bacterium]|nr:BatA domain-containing protein [Saprospiraceae bacterium]
MQFLFPAFLFALAALAIPVIIHLFHFRRFKKVYFTNVRFLREVKEETSTRSRLRNILVLLMRMLAIAFLVLAFAQPFFSRDEAVDQGQKAISIFVDNSFSMSALSSDLALLDKARQRAREVVDAFSEEDRFQILTMDFEGRHQRLVSKDDAYNLIDEIEVSPSVRTISEILNRQKQVLNQAPNAAGNSYVISDFQQSISDVESYQDSTIDLNLVPLRAVQEKNISIDSAWFDAPVQMVNQTNPLIVRVQNYSNEDAENIRLSIMYEGQTKPVGTLQVPARSSVIDTVNITIQQTGFQEARLQITDFPVQFDDAYYISFEVAEQINVLTIQDEQPNRFLRAAFQSVPLFRLVSEPSQNLDYSSFPNYQLIVLDDLRSISSGLASELKEYIANGGNVLAFPSPNAELSAYNPFLSGISANELVTFDTTQRQVSNINTEEFIFQDIFAGQQRNLKLPITTRNFRLTSYNNRPQEVLLRYRDGSPFLSKYSYEGGKLYLCAAPLDDTYNDLVRNGEVFIPMLIKMAISSGEEARIAYTIGSDAVLEADHQVNRTEIVYKLRGEGEEFIPQQRILGDAVLLTSNNQIEEAGFYDLFLEEGEVLDKFAFNYDRAESDLRYFTPEQLAERFGEDVSILEASDNAILTARISQESQGIPLWRWCIILALVFLGVEVLLLRFWKV